MKRVFIVNPKAGNGRSLKMINAIKEICKEEKLNYEIVYTTDKGDATNIARKNSSNIDETIIYSVGGDGTLNEVVNGIVGSNAVLGVIPGGTGNDFYKSIKQNGRMIDKADVGLVNDRYFINVASLGLDARIAAKANDLKKTIFPNKLVYYAGLISEFINLKSDKILTDDIEKQLLLISVCNGMYYGGGIKIAPNASINDGLFDIYELNNTTRIELLKAFKEMLKAVHDKNEHVNFYKANYLTINTPYDMVCNVDGEIIIDKKFEFTNIENGINLLYNDHPKIKQMCLKKK